MAATAISDTRRDRGARSSGGIRRLLMVPLLIFVAINLGAILFARSAIVPASRPVNRHTPADYGLPYEVRYIGLPNGDVLEGWLVTRAQARGLVIMFHDQAASKESLLAPAAVMYEWGYSSLLIDFRGSGGSSRNDTTFGVREAEDVAAATLYAEDNWPGFPTVLYGISTGSGAILRAIALEGARPEALILEGTFDRLTTTARNRIQASGIPGALSSLPLFWGGILAGYNPSSHNPVEYASAITFPTLMLHGELDRFVSTDQARAVYDELGGAKRMVIIPGVGHEMPFLNEAPELWRKEAAQLLEQLPGPR